MAQLVKTLNGLAIASVKLVSGLAIASAKTINGLDNTSGGGSPTLLYDGINSTGEGQWDFQDQNSHYYSGNYNFTVSANCTVTEIKFKLSKINGSITGLTYFAAVYNMSGNNLGTVVGTSDGVTGSDSWAKTTVSFTFSTPASLTTSGTYAVLVYTSGTIGTTNYAATWYTTPTVIPGQMTYFSNTGVNQFVGTFGNYDIQFQIWGTTP